jgi:hypothetical protein
MTPAGPLHRENSKRITVTETLKIIGGMGGIGCMHPFNQLPGSLSMDNVIGTDKTALKMFSESKCIT